jgi:hypothetical protein
MTLDHLLMLCLILSYKGITGIRTYQLGSYGNYKRSIVYPKYRTVVEG